MMAAGGADAPLFAVRGLTVSFKPRSAWFFDRRRVRAVNDVSFDVAEGETLALVGESGSGKSTVARAILRLIPSDAGSVRLEGRELMDLSERELRPLRRHMQMVFQDPYSSINPSMVVSDVIGEPLEVHERLEGAARNARVAELLVQVGLMPSFGERYAYEFSGGQRQRIAIARAIALKPKLVICDEAVSALDVSTQNQIINLLEDLQAELGVSFLFISHGLAAVRHIARRVAVLYLGRLVELGPTERLYEAPAHPYSLALLSAVPAPNPRIQRSRQRIVLRGDPPDPTQLPPGCPFAGRCPYTLPVCAQVMPPLTAVEGGGEVACHLQTSGPVLAGSPLRAYAAAATG